MARIYAPHRFRPNRGKDYDYCDICGLFRADHNLKYEKTELCNKPIPGTGLFCDQHKDHDASDDPETACCSADDGEPDGR